MIQVEPFRFKQFEILQDRSAMKVGTDGILLGAWADVAAAKNSLDIGAGTGLIAMMLAQRNTDLQSWGVEIHSDTAQQAQENAAACTFSSRLHLSEGDITVFADAPEQQHFFDIIVTNPPFFTGGTLSNSQLRNDVRHTAKLSHGDLIRAVKRLLAPSGRFSLVLPPMEALRFEEWAVRAGMFLSRKLEVYPRPNKPLERILMEFQLQQPVAFTTETLYLQTEEMLEANQYSPEFIALTQDFYPFM